MARPLILVALLLVACRGGGGSSARPSGSGANSPSQTPPSGGDKASPVQARFVELPAEPTLANLGPCDELFVGMVQGEGRVQVEGEFAAGTNVVSNSTISIRDEEWISIHHALRYAVFGSGKAVVARMNASGCANPPSVPEILRAEGKDKWISWGKGGMRARFDLAGERAKLAYVGRLEGTLGVAEHSHDDAWEVLCALDAEGTFTLAGVSRVLKGGECVEIAPRIKHSWKPAPGTKLRAIQFYDPPGPEQRFKKLAAEDAIPIK